MNEKSTITCTRIIGFDYGHRILGHLAADGKTPGKCSSLHGHRGTVEITCNAASLDNLGMVIDFGKVKELVGGWIDENWDHRMILNHADPLLSFRLRTENPDSVYGPKAPFITPDNPTAENLAKWLWSQAEDLLKPHGIEVAKIKFWETPNCYAEYIPGRFDREILPIQTPGSNPDALELEKRV